MKKIQLIAASMVFSFGVLFLLSACGSSSGTASAASGVTAAMVAGVFNYTDYSTTLPSATMLCGGLQTGSVTLTATSSTGGTFSVTANGTQSLCISGTITSSSTTAAGTFSGTFTVNADGSGTLSGGGSPLSFQFSKDLNTVVISDQSSTQIDSILGLRM